MADATVTITAAVPQAITVEARELRPGDHLFDVYGGTHRIVSVHAGPAGSGRIITRRDDRIRDWWAPTELVTILRK